MALRDKLANGAQPLLPPGEQIRHLWIGQTGPNPMWFLLTYIIFFFIKYRVIVVTDQNMYVLKKSFWTSKSTELLATLPRTRVGPVSGLWAATVVGDEKLWVHKRFHKDIDASDRSLDRL